jgi:hypothetical protein
MSLKERLELIEASHIKLMTDHEMFVRDQEKAWSRHEQFVREQEKAWTAQAARDAKLDERVDKLIAAIGRLVEIAGTRK